MKKVALHNPSSSYLDDLPFEDLERLIKDTEQRIARLSDEYYKYDGTTGHGHQKQKYIKREIDTLKRDLKGYGQSWERKMRNPLYSVKVFDDTNIEIDHLIIEASNVDEARQRATSGQRLTTQTQRLNPRIKFKVGDLVHPYKSENYLARIIEVIPDVKTNFYRFEWIRSIYPQDTGTGQLNQASLKKAKNPNPSNGFFDSFPLNTSGASASHIPQVESLNRADSFYVKDSSSGSISQAVKTRHAADKLAARLNKSEGRERYYVIGIEYEENRKNPSPRTNFHKLSIGEKFHTGKSKTKDGFPKYEVLEKTDKSTAQVIEVFGGYHTLGHFRKFTAFDTVYTNVN